MRLTMRTNASFCSGNSINWRPNVLIEPLWPMHGTPLYLISSKLKQQLSDAAVDIYEGFYTSHGNLLISHAQKTQGIQPKGHFHPLLLFPSANESPLAWRAL